MKIVNYLAENIDWKRTTDSQYPFAAEFEGEKCIVRLNDFPDEHLYTLIVNGKETVSFDDWSVNWNRPARRKKVGQNERNKSMRVKAGKSRVKNLHGEI